MRTLGFVAAMVVAAACSRGERSDGAKPELATLTVDQLDQALARHDAQPVDANGEQTRKKLGVIPGALLLTDSESFALSELPADKAKPLVFYCANTSCGSSHQAADRAVTAGYTDVKVLPAGIAGWVKAGKKTSAL